VDVGDGDALPPVHRAAFERERDRLVALLEASSPQPAMVAAAN